MARYSRRGRCVMCPYVQSVAAVVCEVARADIRPPLETHSRQFALCNGTRNVTNGSVV